MRLVLIASAKERQFVLLSIELRQGFDNSTMVLPTSVPTTQRTTEDDKRGMERTRTKESRDSSALARPAEERNT